MILITCPECKGSGFQYYDAIVPEDSPRCWLCKGAKTISRHVAKGKNPKFGWGPETIQRWLSGAPDPEVN